MSDVIHSKDLEREVLSGIIKHPHIFPEVDRFLSEQDFFLRENYAIYCVLRQMVPENIANNERVNPVLLSERIDNFGMKFHSSFDIFNYVDGMAFSQISEKATLDAVRQLQRKTLLRDCDLKIADEIKKYVRSCGDDDPDSIIAKVFELSTHLIQDYNVSNDPVNLTDGLLDMIKDRANNPVESVGIPWPSQFERLNKVFGGLRIGNISFIGARAKQGKSTFLAEVAYQAAKSGVKVLCLDTEMLTDEIRFRLAASLTGIGSYKLETGKWNTDAKLLQQFKDAEDVLEEVYPIYHLYVPMVRIEKVCSFIRRFKYAYCERDEPFLVLYDYMKLTGEDDNNNKKSYELLGKKTAQLKACCSDVGAACLSAVQLNREGEHKNRKYRNTTKDLSVISGSDQIAQLADKVFWWGEKSDEEIHNDNALGIDHGTHMLMPLAARHQGEEALGFYNTRHRVLADGSEIDTPYYINFTVDNFKVTEEGDVDNIIDRESQRRGANDDARQSQVNQNDGSVELE